MHAVGFPVINSDPVGIKLCRSIGGTRVEWRRLTLGDLPYQPVKLRSRGLIKTYASLHTEDADRLEQSQGTKAVSICCVFRRLERDLNVALCGKIVDLVGSCLLHNSDQVGGVGQVAVMQGEAHVLFVRILIKMVHPASVEGGGTTLNTV